MTRNTLPFLPPSLPPSLEKQLEGKIKTLEEKVETLEKKIEIVSMLATAPPTEQKQMLGERMFPLIKRINPDLAGKITGMMLEKKNKEILKLIENEVDLTKEVQDAVDTLNKHKK